MAGLHGRKREADSERAFAAAALLGGQYDRLHCKKSFGLLGWESAIRSLCCTAFCDAEHSRSGHARPIPENLSESQQSESPNVMRMTRYQAYDYSGTIRARMRCGVQTGRDT